MKYNNFRSISKSEIEDCESACKKYSLDFSEFSLSEHDVTETPRTDSLHYINANLTVSKNGTSKTYKTGHGTSWPSDFDADLRSGFFGQ